MNREDYAILSNVTNADKYFSPYYLTPALILGSHGDKCNNKLDCHERLVCQKPDNSGGSICKDWEPPLVRENFGQVYQFPLPSIVNNFKFNTPQTIPVYYTSKYKTNYKY